MKQITLDRSTVRHYRIERSDIAYVRFILEGYEGLATMTTLNPEAGHIAVRAASGDADTLDALIGSLRGEIRIEPTAPTAPDLLETLLNA